VENQVSELYKEKKVAIDTLTWTAIRPLMVCSRVGLKTDDGSSFKTRTLDTDATTEDTAAADVQKGVAVVAPLLTPLEIVIYAQATLGTPYIIVACAR
jgi:hypothetical protein